MPPQLRLPIRTLSPLPKALAFHPVPPFILPFLHPRLLSHVQLRQQPQSRRYASVLSGLSSPSGAYSKKIRRGRGPSSGKGKTSGRGHKGQKQHGKVPKGFTGGQTKVEVAKGKRGFKNVFAAKLSPLNLDRVQAWINEGRLDTSKPITLKELSESRCLHGIKADGVKLLARDAEKLTHPINIVVSRASAAAIAAVERVGGQVVTRYYTQQSIRRILRGESHPTGPLESFPIDPPLSSVPALPTSSFPAITTPSWSISATIKSPISASAVAAPNGTGGASGLEKGRYEYALGYHYRLPNPAARKAIEYYRDPAHRGYLAHTLDNGQGPSLFFRSDAERAAEKERKMKGRGEGGKAGRKREVDNRLF